MLGYRRRALLGLAVVAAVLSLLNPTFGVALDEVHDGGGRSWFTNGISEIDGASRAVLQPTGSPIQHEVGQLAIAGAAAAILSVALLWRLVASSEGRDADFGATGFRWRRRGPPHALLPA